MSSTYVNNLEGCPSLLGPHQGCRVFSGYQALKPFVDWDFCLKIYTYQAIDYSSAKAPWTGIATGHLSVGFHDATVTLLIYMASASKRAAAASERRAKPHLDYTLVPLPISCNMNCMGIKACGDGIPHFLVLLLCWC